MRILVASNSYPTRKNPTRQVFIQNIVEGLRDQNHHVDIIYNLYFRFFKSDVETGNFLTKFLKVSFLFLSYLPYLLIKCRNYDIIYSHAPVLPGFILTFASKLYNIKHVTYAHGSVLFTEEKELLFKLSKYTMHTCDLVFTNSKYMRHYLSRHYNVESCIVTPGYNHHLFNNFGYTERPIDLLFAGNCVRTKGIYTLLEAIKNHSAFYMENNLSVFIYCSGVEKEGVNAFQKRHQLEEIITLGKKLTQKELSVALNKARIVVLPSLKEALGLVGIEALACGAYIIASETGGIPEYLNHEENGLLFEPGNSEQLHHGIRNAIEGKLWVRNQNNQNKIDQSLEKYTLNAGIEQTLYHFNNLLTENESNSPDHSL